MSAQSCFRLVFVCNRLLRPGDWVREGAPKGPLEARFTLPEDWPPSDGKAPVGPPNYKGPSRARPFHRMGRWVAQKAVHIQPFAFAI